ncbi:hypothetical protein KC359_g20 [Hortaea werneckii]|nr:hypothetical protein KC359_g20 [Hortaea werneckii]
MSELPQLYSKFICMTESRGLLGGLSGGLASGPHGRCCGRPRNVRSSVHPDTSGLSQVAARQHVVPVASYDHLCSSTCGSLPTSTMAAENCRMGHSTATCLESKLRNSEQIKCIYSGNNALWTNGSPLCMASAGALQSRLTTQDSTGELQSLRSFLVHPVASWSFVHTPSIGRGDTSVALMEVAGRYRPGGNQCGPNLSEH